MKYSKQITHEKSIVGTAARLNSNKEHLTGTSTGTEERENALEVWAGDCLATATLPGGGHLATQWRGAAPLH